MLQKFLPKEKKEYNKSIKYTRILTSEYPTLPYHPRKNQVRFPLHWGQRKLLNADIEFITENYDKSKIYICAGGADGSHYKILAKMFPMIEFHLYDPRAFYKGLYSIANINLYRQFWTKETAEEWKKRKESILFVSDIRTIPKKGEVKFHDRTNATGSEKFEKQITEDMVMQKEWVEMLTPVAAMLKFKLPYCDPKVNYGKQFTKYLQGEIRFQTWAPPSSTETRLWCYPINKFKETFYDDKIYEDQMFRFNQITRIQWHELDLVNKKNIVDFPGYEFNYDTATEIKILIGYLKKFVVDEPTVKDLKELFDNINNNMLRKFKSTHHGKEPLKPFHEKTPIKST